jgi:hypothetical protein
VAGELLHVQAQATSPLRDAHHSRSWAINQARQHPRQVTGGAAYPRSAAAAMVHAQVIRPPSCGARLLVGTSAIERMSERAQIVRDGNFLAVVSERIQAVKAMRALAALQSGKRSPACRSRRASPPR